LHKICEHGYRLKFSRPEFYAAEAFEHDKPQLKWCVWANITTRVETNGTRHKGVSLRKNGRLIHYSANFEKVIGNAKCGFKLPSRLFIEVISSFSFHCETGPNRIGGLPAIFVGDR
jgi:hypothetical protein